MAANAIARKPVPRRRPGKTARRAAPKGGRGRRARAEPKGRAPGRVKAKRQAAGPRTGPGAVAAHFAKVPPGRREPMLRLWALVQDALPGSTALVSYGIAIASVGGRWVAGVGGGKAHTGLYLMSPDFVRAHAAELAGQDTSGGTVRFPLGKPIPAPLVRRLVRTRLVSLGEQFGADEARMEPARLPTKPAAPEPAPLDRFPRPMLVPLDKPPKT